MDKVFKNAFLQLLVDLARWVPSVGISRIEYTSRWTRDVMKYFQTLIGANWNRELHYPQYNSNH